VKIKAMKNKAIKTEVKLITLYSIKKIEISPKLLQENLEFKNIN